MTRKTGSGFRLSLSFLLLSLLSAGDASTSTLESLAQRGGCKNPQKTYNQLIDLGAHLAANLRFRESRVCYQRALRFYWKSLQAPGQGMDSAFTAFTQSKAHEMQAMSKQLAHLSRRTGRMPIPLIGHKVEEERRDENGRPQVPPQLILEHHQHAADEAKLEASAKSAGMRPRDFRFKELGLQTARNRAMSGAGGAARDQRFGPAQGPAEGVPVSSPTPLGAGPGETSNPVAAGINVGQPAHPSGVDPRGFNDNFYSFKAQKEKATSSSKADALADTHMPTAEELEKMDYTAQLRSIEKLVTNRNVRKVSTNVRRPSSLGAHSTVRGYQAPSHVGRVADDYVA